MSARLEVDCGMYSIAGIKPINEDSVAANLPEDDYLRSSKGLVLSLADGVSSAEAGREASRTAVARFSEEYMQTPDTWSVSHSGEKVLSALNLKLYRKSHEFENDAKGYLCTFTALVLKGQTGHYFHVGDSRLYLWRRAADGEVGLRQISRDHVASVAQDKSFLTRAVGMDNRLHIDYGKLPLEKGDRLLLTSDGVHDFLSEAQIREHLGGSASAQAIAEQLVNAALEQGSDDNISAVVAMVEALPAESLDDYSAKLTRLPFPPDLSPGMKLDGYLIEKELFASSRSQLYLVKDEESGQRFAMKTPSRNYEDDISYIDRFIQEEWVGQRIDSPHVVKIIRQQRPRSCLYYIMEYVRGQGLDAWMEANPQPKPKRAIAVVKQIAAGLQAFHNNEAIHQDLKPGNILIDENDLIKIVDFGSVHVAGLAEMYRPLEHEGALGTASYSDPLYLAGTNPGIQGDVYALATITYELFTGELPYGDKVEDCRSAFDYDRLRYQPASHFNPVIPVWFDKALQKGVAFDLEKRYTTIAALLHDLTQPNPEFLRDDPEEEEKASTLMFWKLLSGFWFITLLLVIYLFVQAG